MSNLTEREVRDCLQQVPLPDLPQCTVADVVDELVVEGGAVRLKLVLGYPCEGLYGELQEAIKAACPSAESLAVEIVARVLPASSNHSQGGIAGVKNIIAVASGKGGVGKSTTAVNIALALVAEGARVGLLDADIYGPSLPQMLGVADQRPEIVDQKLIVPIAAHGIQSSSMGYMVTENTPMVWRGPMATGALQQLLNSTRWDNLDYLIVDMPPGTGDIQLTLSQQVPVSGSIIVTTPQDIALLDARKGIEMFNKVSIPVLGVVENMSTYICPQCGHQEAIFGDEGGLSLAQSYGAELLGKLPLQLAIREQTDAGKPPLAVDPESAVSQIYRSIARKMSGSLWLRLVKGGSSSPEISIVDD